jgi:hypothetical protein
MNPMSLLTLPVSTLQAAWTDGERPNPSAERLERLVAVCAFTVIAVASVFAAAL